MNVANKLVQVLTNNSKTSARSIQVDVGPSEIGGCKRRTWNRLNNVPTTNHDTLHLAGIMGTAIHTYIQEAFNKQDPFGDKYLLEVEVSAAGIRGHVDMYDKENGEVVDWKTTKKSNLGYFPSLQQRWQVQLYGFLLTENGYNVKTVTLVGIPRDGDERDIVYHSEPYDAKIAADAIDWLIEVRNTIEPPQPEKDVSYCKLYCNFYDATGQVGCTGRPKAEAEGVIIEDALAINAAHDYLHLSQQITELEARKEAAKSALEGINGITPDGIRVTWSSVAGRKMIDEEILKALIDEIPYRYGKESTRLSVK